MVSVESVLALGLGVAILAALSTYSYETLQTVADQLRTLLAG